MKIRVAVVDDCDPIRDLLAKALSTQPDMELVGQAADGHKAVDMVRKSKPDIVAMDQNMPGMTGIEATRIITSEQPGVRIIGLSAFAELSLADAMIGAGAARVLDKTAAIAVLLKAIRDESMSKRSLDAKITSKRSETSTRP